MLQLSDLQNDEIINKCGFKPLSLLRYTAIENEYKPETLILVPAGGETAKGEALLAAVKSSSAKILDLAL